MRYCIRNLDITQHEVTIMGKVKESIWEELEKPQLNEHLMEWAREQWELREQQNQWLKRVADILSAPNAEEAPF